MHTVKSLLVAAVAVGAVASSAKAAVSTFIFPITVDQEVPTPTFNPGQLIPAGVGFVTYDDTTNLFTFDISYAGLTGPIVAPGAHVHGPADFGVTAPILFDLHDSLPKPASGTLSGNIVLTSEQEQFLFDGLLYVNIHTAQNQPGEIRGQIIPEPAAAGLLALTGVLSLARRRRR